MHKVSSNPGSLYKIYNSWFIGNLILILWYLGNLGLIWFFGKLSGTGLALLCVCGIAFVLALSLRNTFQRVIFAKSQEANNLIFFKSIQIAFFIFSLMFWIGWLITPNSIHYKTPFFLWESIYINLGLLFSVTVLILLFRLSKKK